MIGILINIISSILFERGKASYLQLTNDEPISKAIVATATSFNDVESLQESLSLWCKSDFFIKVLFDLKNGRREFTDDDIINSFIQESDFDFREKTFSKAQSIVTLFLKNLIDQLLQTPHGLSIVSNQIEKNTNSIFSKISETSKEVTKEITVILDEKLAQNKKEIKEILNGKSISTDVENLPEVQELLANNEIVNAVELLNSGKAKTAIKKLRKLREEFTENTTSLLQYKVATNIAACALQLGDTEVVKEQIKLALILQPKKQQAISNAAFVALMEGKFDEALEFSHKARLMNSEDPRAICNYLRSLFCLEKWEELNSEINRLCLDNGNALIDLCLGHIEFSRSKFEKAQHFFEKALNKEDTLEANLFLAKSILNSIRLLLHDTPPLKWKMSDDTIDQIHRAELLLSKSLKLLRQTDYQEHFLYETYLERASARVMLDRPEDGIRDCDIVIDEDETFIAAKRSKAMILQLIGRYQEAIDLFLKYLSVEDSLEVKIALADSYISIKKPLMAIELLTGIFNVNDIGNPKQLRIAHIFLASYIQLNNADAANELILKLKENGNNDPNLLSVLADYYNKTGNPIDAINTYKLALSYATVVNKEFIMFNLAELYFSQNEYSEAAQFYKQTVNVKINNEPLQKYLSALFKSRQYNVALEISKKLRNNGEPIPFVSEIEGLIYTYIDDFIIAKEIFSKLSTLEPLNPFHKIRVIYLLLRRNEMDAAQNLLSTIKIENIKDNVAILFNIANIKMLLQEKDLLSFAYRAWRINYNNPDAHLAYLNYYLSQESTDNNVLEQDIVAIDSAVYIKNGGDEKVFIITDEVQSASWPIEISPTNTIAIKLLGHKVGDTVPFKDEPLEHLSYEITKIISKYKYAYIDIWENFTTLFPNHPGLQVIDTSNNDFSKILFSIDQKHKFTTEMENLCYREAFPYSSLAKLLAVNIVKAWGGIIHHKEKKLMASIGSLKQIKNRAITISPKGNIVIDLFTLLSLNHLNLLNKLTEFFNLIYIAQSGLDELNDAITDLSFPAKPHHRTWKEGDYYIMDEVTEESIDRNRKFLICIRDFILTYGVNPPVNKILEIGEEYENYADSIGKSAIDSILIASEHNTLLFSDDLALRNVGNTFSVGGIDSQSVLLKMFHCKLLTQGEYFQALIKLIHINYNFVFVNEEVLMWLLKHENMNLTSPVICVFETFQTSEYNEDVAVSIMARLIRNLWLDNLSDDNFTILDLILKILTTNRLTQKVLIKFKNALNFNFKLLPIHLPPILKVIDHWQQYKAHNGDLII